jgi:hypothetical protein
MLFEACGPHKVRERSGGAGHAEEFKTFTCASILLSHPSLPSGAAGPRRRGGQPRRGGGLGGGGGPEKKTKMKKVKGEKVQEEVMNGKTLISHLSTLISPLHSSSFLLILFSFFVCWPRGPKLLLRGN